MDRVPDLRNLPGGDGPGFGAFDHCQFDTEAESVRIGKKFAGRLLDGVQHDGYPLNMKAQHLPKIPERVRAPAKREARSES